MFQGNCRLWYCPTDSAALKSACIPILREVETATYQVRLTVEVEDDSDSYLQSMGPRNLTSNLLSAMFKDGDNAEIETILIAENQTGSSLFIIVLMRISSANDGTPLFRLENFNRTYNVSTAPDRLLMVSVRLAIGIMLEIVTYPNWNIHVFDTISYKAFTISYISDDILKVYEYPILEKLAFCLQVMLDKYEFADLIGAIWLGRSGMRLYTGEFIRVPDSRKVRICYDDFVKNAPERLFQFNEGSAMPPQVTTSIVCTSLSITCLGVTILTYTIFSDLRTIPGKNNIVLSIHLLVAQCLYQFTFTATDHPSPCIAFGIMMHFFWLTSILWMSACTVHMFRTFVTKKSFRSKRQCEPQVCMYALCCYILAAVPVAINIGVSLKESDGNSIGYGGHICYISNPLMVGLTFALPVGIIVILNMVFFLIVMFKISESTMRYNKSADRTNAIIYVKLSSLTGTTWIFGYIYLWTGFAPLEYVFIVLNAGQGVLIFFSFVCNVKVLRLYQDFFWRHSRPLMRTFCKSYAKHSNPKQQRIDNAVKGPASLKVSAESIKTDLSANRPSTVYGLQFDHDPVCLTVGKSVDLSGPVVPAIEYEMGGIITKAGSIIPSV